MAWSEIPRHSPVARRQLTVLSLDECASRNGAAYVAFLIVGNWFVRRNAAGGYTLYTQRPFPEARGLPDVRTALASGLHGAGNGKGNVVGASIYTRDEECRHRFGDDYGLSWGWASQRPWRNSSA